MFSAMIIILLIVISGCMYGLLKYLLGYNGYIYVTCNNKTIKERIIADSFLVKLGNDSIEIQKQGEEWRYKYNDNDFSPVLLNEEIAIGNYSFCIKDNNKIQKFVRKYFAIISLIPILLPIVYISWGLLIHSNNQNVQPDSNPIVEEDYTVPNSSIDDTDQAETTEKIEKKEDSISTRNEPISIISAKGIQTVTVKEVTKLVFSENTVFVDSKNVQFLSNELIGRKLCLYYKGASGEDCFWVGQYNSRYHWDGECCICAYKDGKLLYTTQDVYEDENVKEYVRFSYKLEKNKWYYSNKQVTNGKEYYGDTYAYTYADVKAKRYDTAIPQEEYLYTIAEVQDLLSDSLISHYKGGYNSEQDWCDTSGSAYRFIIDKGQVKEIFKGTFFTNRYGTGHLIRIDDNNSITFIVGQFNDENGNSITGGTVERQIDYDELMIIIKDQPYMEEAMTGLSYLQ